jgi:signal transduction histidine kinase
LQGTKSTYDVEMIRTDGVKRDVRVFAAPNYDRSGRINGSLGIFEDITDQILNESIRSQQEREIDLYGSLLRHDLRNDLGLILSYIEAVQMLTDSPDEDVNSFLDSGIATIERMANLLTNFGRPQDVREVDVVDFIKEIADEAEEAEQNLQIKVSYKERTKPVTLMAGSLLALVFMNLFRNSAQHAGERPLIDVEVTNSDGQLAISVSDNGPGVPEEFQDKLFARGTSSKGEAGGLGLHLCKQIIERIGGSIELDKDAKGATFQIELPVEA